MIVNKEFILNEEDIKEAIHEYLEGDFDDPNDDVTINFVYENINIKDDKLVSLKLSAFAREEGTEC